MESSKAAEPHELGLHLRWYFERGELSYSSQAPERMEVRWMDRLQTDTHVISASSLLETPPTEVAYWGDSFVEQAREWAIKIQSREYRPRLATIRAGVETQSLID